MFNFLIVVTRKKYILFYSFVALGGPYKVYLNKSFLRGGGDSKLLTNYIVV